MINFEESNELLFVTQTANPYLFSTLIHFTYTLIPFGVIDKLINIFTLMKHTKALLTKNNPALKNTLMLFAEI